MAQHESSVNFENLITDLADMYPYDVGTVVLTELVANSLDSKATTIGIDFDATHNTLRVWDNGIGMSVAGFDQYHDFAAGLKTRRGFSHVLGQADQSRASTWLTLITGSNVLR